MASDRGGGPSLIELIKSKNILNLLDSAGRGSRGRYSARSTADQGSSFQL